MTRGGPLSGGLSAASAWTGGGIRLECFRKALQALLTTALSASRFHTLSDSASDCASSFARWIGFSHAGAVAGCIVLKADTAAFGVRSLEGVAVSAGR